LRIACPHAVERFWNVEVNSNGVVILMSPSEFIAVVGSHGEAFSLIREFACCGGPQRSGLAFLEMPLAPSGKSVIFLRASHA
jgi:hypothetical protein